MFIRIYVEQIREERSRGVWHFQQPESHFCLNPMHIVYVDVEGKKVFLTNGMEFWTDSDGVKDVRNSEICAYVTHNPNQ